MTIASVSSGAPRPAQPAKATPAAAKPAKSFADLMGQLDQAEPAADGMGAFFPPPESNVDLLQFNVAAQVSANAIRFDARPILGETNMAFAGDAVLAAVTTGTQPHEANPLAALQDRPIGIEQVRWLLSALAEQLGDAVKQPGGQAGQLGTSATPASGNQVGATVAAAQRRLPAGVASARATSSPPPNTAQAAQNKALFAKLAMHPLEIRLVIHGAQLSASDLAALTDELTGLLAGTRFADRPVRVLAATRRI